MLGIGYTSYNLPNLIMSGSNSSTLSYGAHRNRYKQVSVAGGVTETTIYVGGLLEKVTRGSVTEYRHLIRGGKGVAAIYTRPTSGAATTYYVHADHLGSPELITDSAGAQVVKLSFGAYGERRGSNWSGTPSSGDWTAIGNTTRDGFTGHEHLDAVSLIHMNGRVYDPVVGRFLSADPVLDLGLGAQSANRYAYVGNRPLSFVDPSGYNCEAPEGMSDDEASDYITRCNDAYDSGGWGAIRENERWCQSLDTYCYLRNWYASGNSENPMSWISTPRGPAVLPDLPGDLPQFLLLPDELQVIGQRVGAAEFYRWQADRDAAGSTRLIEATLPDGSTGWVATDSVSQASSTSEAVVAVSAVILTADQAVALRLLAPLATPAFSIGEAIGLINLPSPWSAYRTHIGGAQVAGGIWTVTQGVMLAYKAPTMVPVIFAFGGGYSIGRGIDDMTGGALTASAADALCAALGGCAP